MPASEEWIESYLQRALSAYLPPDKSVDPALAQRIYECIKNGLNRINEIPRYDPLWRGTNGEPTIGKMQEFASKLLARDPKDFNARWSLVAYSLHVGENHFAAAYLEPLIQEDFKNLRWLVAGARWLYLNTGVQTLPRLREWLRKLKDADPEFDRKLYDLREDDDIHTSRMARWAAEAMAGEDPFKEDK